MHTTNHSSTFISVAEDCVVETAVVPPPQPVPTAARMLYEMIGGHPYRYTSDEVLFHVFAQRNGIEPADLESRRAAFFSRGQACLRASALGKRYGWGILHDERSRVALFARESEAYRRLSSDPGLKQLKAMKNKR